MYYSLQIRMPFIRDMIAIHKKMTPHFDEVALFVFPFTQDKLFSTNKKSSGHESRHDRFQKAFRLVLLCTVVTCHVQCRGRLDTSQTQLHSTLFIKSYDSEPKNQL